MMRANSPCTFRVSASTSGVSSFVSGSASNLYKVLWNRRDAAGSELEGDLDLLDLWRKTVRITWS